MAKLAERTISLGGSQYAVVPVHDRADVKYDARCIGLPNNQLGWLPVFPLSENPKYRQRRFYHQTHGWMAFHDAPQMILTIDNFEDGTLNEYGKKLAGAKQDPFSIQTANTHDGQYALLMDGDSTGSGNLYSMSGLANYPRRGDRWWFWWKTHFINREQFDVSFCVQSSTLDRLFEVTHNFGDKDAFPAANFSLDFNATGPNGPDYLDAGNGVATPDENANEGEIDAQTWYRTVVDGGYGQDGQWLLRVDRGEGTNAVVQYYSDITIYNYQSGGLNYFVSANDRVDLDGIQADPR